LFFKCFQADCLTGIERHDFREARMSKGRHHAERARGAKEHSQQLHALRAKWPLAFPAQPEDVRPLALGVADQIAAAMDWSVQYTLGVLRPWKMAPFYCRAVLSHDQRITLDGAPAETLDAETKEKAAKVLAKKAAAPAKPAAKSKPMSAKPKPARAARPASR
jgi:sRNA-binding protein